MRRDASDPYFVPQDVITSSRGFGTLQGQVNKVPRNFKLTTTSLVGTEPGKFINVAPATLLQQAIQKLGQNMTLEEYTVARVIASETGESAPLVEQILVAQATLNLGRRLGIVNRVTGNYSNYSGSAESKGKFGRQIGRAVASSQDPTHRTLLVARAVLAKAVDPIFGDVIQFYGLAASKSQPGVTSSARKTLGRWTTGTNGTVWVGRIAGLDDKKNHLFFRSRRSADTAVLRKEAQDKLLAVLAENGF